MSAAPKKMAKAKTVKKKAATGNMKVAVFDQDGKKLKDSELSAPICPPAFSQSLLTAAVRMYQTNQRTGTSKVLNRHQVSGSGRKIYKQKGTGQARHGDITAPIFVGGGVTFGPRPREWRYKMPKKALKKALASAITYVSQNGKICLLDKLDWSKPKTKQGASLIKKLGLASPLFVLDTPTEPVIRSLRNIPGVGIIEAEVVNALDVLKHNELVMTVGSLAKLEKRIAGGVS